MLCPPAAGEVVASCPSSAAGVIVDQLRQQCARVRALARSCPAFATAAAGTQGRNAGRTYSAGSRSAGNLPELGGFVLPAAVVDGMGSRSIGGGGRVPSSSTLASLDSSTDGGEMAALMEDETKAEEAAEAAAAEAEAAKQWNVDHAAALQELNRAVWAAYAHLADAGDPQHSAALQHVLPLPFALGARLYSLLLLATFGRDGVPLPSTDGVVALLRFVKAPLSLSPVQSHLIAFAEATFVTHRRHPRVVDLAAALLHRVKAAADTLPRMSYAEAALFHASARAMREHFRQQLSNLHAAFAEAPPALLQVRPPPLPPRTPHPPRSLTPLLPRLPPLFSTSWTRTCTCTPCTQPSRRSAAPTSPSIDGYRPRPPPPPKSPPAPPPPPSPPPRARPRSNRPTRRRWCPHRRCPGRR